MNNQEYNRQRYENAKKAYAALMKFYPLTLEDLPEEVWLPVPDFDKYQVSNFGRVKSFWGNTKILKPQLLHSSYMYVSLCKDRHKKVLLIHRLVAKAFIPNPEEKPEVNHKDGHQLNNHVSNLEWATSLENKVHAIGTGLVRLAEDRSNAKLTNAQVLYIRDNPDCLTQYELADLFDVDQVKISKIQLGKLYKSVGGTIRPKYRIPDLVRNQIKAEYVFGSREFGCRALAKKYGTNPTTVCSIVKEI